MSNFPLKARYEKVMFHVNQLFAKEGVDHLPINPLEIIKQNKWGLITYSELAEENGVTLQEIIDALQSEDGYTIYDGENYTIAYNDTISVNGRILFTLMHEIGHIYMNHLIDFEETILLRSALTEQKYRVLENEANTFARNAIAPVMVVKDLRIVKPEDAVTYFNMSRTAAKVRLDVLMLDYIKLSGNFIKFQREHFHGFVYSALHSKVCLLCNTLFVGESPNFCPCCGSSEFTDKKGGIPIVKYPGINVDDSGKAFVCPSCQNEELENPGDYCKICGTLVFNMCTNSDGYTECNLNLEGNARYCPICGGKSTFYRDGLLKDWTEVEKQISPPSHFKASPPSLTPPAPQYKLPF